MSDPMQRFAVKARHARSVLPARRRRELIEEISLAVQADTPAEAEDIFVRDIQDPDVMRTACAPHDVRIVRASRDGGDHAWRVRSEKLLSFQVISVQPIPAGDMEP